MKLHLRPLIYSFLFSKDRPVATANALDSHLLGDQVPLDSTPTQTFRDSRKRSGLVSWAGRRSGKTKERNWSL